MSEAIAFTSVRGPHGWLGNMSPHPLAEPIGDFAGTWRTAEALFQATRFDDLKIREEIRACRSPMQAKMIAKRESARMIIVPRGPEDVANMKRILRLKIVQHPDLAQKLDAFPRDVLIVEDVTARGVSASNVFWGAALIKGEWIGENQLGRLWMKIRGEISLDVAKQIDLFRRDDNE